MSAVSLPAHSSTSPSASPGRKEVVAHQLLRAILRGEYREGDRLTEQAVAAKLGVSRTPVREGLLELEGLGVIQLKRNCGAVVTRFGEVKLREIYEVRRLLEVEAARKACGRIDAQVLEDLILGCEALLDGSQVDEGWQLDEEIHATIAKACGNRRLTYEIRRYATLVAAVRDTVGELLAVHTMTIQEHLSILQALRANDPSRAADAMRSHLEQAEESAVLSVNSATVRQ